MRIGLSALIFVLALLAQSRYSNADIIFSLSPTLQSVAPDSDVTFNIFIRSTVPDQQLTGASVHLSAGLGDGSAGLFTSGTTGFFGDPSPAVAWDFTDAGQAFYSQVVLAPKTLGTTNELLGTATLSTVGVPNGIYTITFITSNNDLSASDQFFLAVNTSVDPLAPTAIYAVPEPASMVVLGMSAAAWGLVKVRRQRKAMAA